MGTEDFKGQLKRLSIEKLIKLRDVANDNLTDRLRDLDDATAHLKEINSAISSHRGGTCFRGN